MHQRQLPAGTPARSVTTPAAAGSTHPRPSHSHPLRRRPQLYKPGDELHLVHVIPRLQLAATYGAPPVDFLPYQVRRALPGSLRGLYGAFDIGHVLSFFNAIYYLQTCSQRALRLNTASARAANKWVLARHCRTRAPASSCSSSRRLFGEDVPQKCA